MVPAFLLAGAIAAFVPSATMQRYLGAGAKRSSAYGVAAISGMVLSLCSCNVVPLFVSIYRRGAGIGPAFTFLFAGPAINVVSAIFVIQVVGVGAGVWRLVSVPLIAILVGIAMALLFRRQEAIRQEQLVAVEALAGAHASWRAWPLFILLLLLVAYGAWDMDWTPKIVGMLLICLPTAIFFILKFDFEEFKEWMWEVWGLLKLVVPVLVPALLLIAFVSSQVSIVWVDRWLSADPGDTWGMIRITTLADVFGALMYFPILSEVAFVKAFLLNGMSIGPGMAILLTGAGLSLPGVIILAREIGWKKIIIYQLLIILFTTLSALLFVSEIGQYICACMQLQ